MNIVLLGYGRMGREIEKIALTENHNIVAKITRQSNEKTFVDGLKDADVAIDFSIAESAPRLIAMALKHKIPVVSGTTGWSSKMEDINQLCLEEKGAFLYASNFSIGVNVFFEINRKLAQVMGNHSVYNPTIEEIHHVHKLDAPSGTAITLAEDILEKHEIKTKWTLSEKNHLPNELTIESKRENEVSGTHIVSYNSPIDTIEIKHIAHNRTGFAQGALLAATWIIGKEGTFTMKDVLDL